jgi:hypothetical protein
LALLGLLRALDANDRELGRSDRVNARAAWGIDAPPLRPQLSLALGITQGEVTERGAAGLAALADACAFGNRKDLNYSRLECRNLLAEAAAVASSAERDRVDLLAALMSDAALKDEQKSTVAATPLCLIQGQGHQHFLERLASVPAEPAPPKRGKGKSALTLSAADCLAEALFEPWRREDPTFSFRWDPEEDVRHALMAGDPTDPAYKPGTQHGANRLAAVGLAALPVAPATRGGRVRLGIVGGPTGPSAFSFAWPIWREASTLSTIRALLSHPDLRRPGALRHLGVEDVVVARRISVGQFLNFGRARSYGAE